MDECVLMLEDDSERLMRFTAVLPLIDPPLMLVHWRNAHRMIRECRAYLDCCRLICLDHDLDLAPGEKDDPGDGLDVVRFLAQLRPKCPILIHSSNGDRALRMVGEFQLNECQVATVLPLGRNWIEQYWRQSVKKLLKIPLGS